MIEPVVDRLKESDFGIGMVLLLRENYARSLLSTGEPEKALPIFESILKELKRNPKRNKKDITTIEGLIEACKMAPKEPPGSKPQG